MTNNDPLFGVLSYDDYEGYKGKLSLDFSKKTIEIELILSELFGESGIEQSHYDTYRMLMKKWGSIVEEVVRAILAYQNENWDSTDHSQSFSKFETVDDVLENIELIQLTIEAKAPSFYHRDGRYAVLLFSAEWVNDDYGLLSVVLIDEAIVKITDQAV